MATISAREARRKKILERGSDRLALITGQIHSFPPDLPHHTPIVADSSPSTPPEGGNEVTPMSVGDETLRSLGSEDTEPNSPLLSRTDQSLAEPRLPFPSSTHQIPAPVEISHPQREVQLWSPKRLSSAITATEKPRLLCSLAFSVLVLLSCMGFPFLGFLIFKPLYLVLVANVTMVVMKLIEQQRRSPAQRSRSPSGGGGGGSDWAEQLGKALEMGLVMKKVADAVFMDCAVYAVVLVCGLTVAERFR